jgi:hypothetical protein
VGAGTEDAVIADAGTRNLAAATHAPGLVFMAIPAGHSPTLADAQAILMERQGAAPLTPAERAAELADEDPPTYAELADGAQMVTWRPLLQTLLDLEGAGALGGIRAVIGKRMNRVRAEQADPLRTAKDDFPALAARAIEQGGRDGADRAKRDECYALAAALLCAAIDKPA